MKIGASGFHYRNFRFCFPGASSNCQNFLVWDPNCAFHISILIVSTGLHYGHFKSGVWLHLLGFSSTSLFLEWNSFKFSEKHVHKLKNMFICLTCKIHETGHNLDISEKHICTLVNPMPASFERRCITFRNVSECNTCMSVNPTIFPCNASVHSHPAEILGLKNNYSPVKPTFIVG